LLGQLQLRPQAFANAAKYLSMFTIPSVKKPAAQGLRQDGLSLLTPEELRATLALSASDWDTKWPLLAEAWMRLPPDLHLRDGGHYRKRRHACFVQDLSKQTLQPVPHRAHWQPVDYNALHGGFERWFEPVEVSVANDPLWTDLLKALGELFGQVKPVKKWFIEAHQFRIDTAGGVGRPTPEGAHRDGVDFVVVLLVGRNGVKGGETRVFDAHGQHGVRFVMEQPLTALLLDDERVIHETTPILPADSSGDGYRDTLVLTYRSAGFQSPN
jgi:hypothetical protein